MPASQKPERVIDKVRRHIQRRDTKAAEDRVMRQVRAEDRYCRFPLCGCGRMKLALDVAHAGEAGHRGMGGNRSLSKTTPENLMLLCRPRHKAHQFSVDKKTLRVEALTDAGLRGPVRWLVRASEVFIPESFALLEDSQGRFYGPTDAGRISADAWFELARERSRHVFETFTDTQSVILRYLATMEH